MNTAEYLDALRRDGEAFISSCETAGFAAPVTSCPDWTVADLCWHVAEVHDFWRTIVSDRRDTWEGYEEPARPADADLPAFYREGLAATVAVLSAVDPAQPNWTWSSDHTAGFVIRRMAQETAVHRWDADDAAGAAVPIEAALASDGIDEFLEHFLQAGSDSAPVGGSVHLHCTDVPGEWTVREGADGFDVAREHAKGDCALRGPASDLLLALWRRAPITSIDVVGDADVAARFLALSTLD